MNGQQIAYLVILLTQTFVLGSSRTVHLSEDELAEYTNGHEIDDYDFTSPEYVDSEPTPIQKRSARYSPISPASPAGSREVKFNAFGETYRVALRRNYWLLRRGLVVERVAADGAVTEEAIPNRECYYFSRLLSHEGESTGALSTCKGLRGQISHGNSDYFISPLKDHHASRVRRDLDPSVKEGDSRAHIIYRRSARSRDRRSGGATPHAYPSSSGVDYEGDDEGVLGSSSDDDDDDYDNRTMIFRNTTATFCSTAYAPGQAPAPQEVASSQAYPWELYPPAHPALDTDYQYDAPGASWNSHYRDNVSYPHPAAEGDTARPAIAADMVASQTEEETTQEGGQRFIEFFVIADSGMVAYHRDDAVDYTLTLMNIVSRRYTESSLRAQIRLAIVRFVVAESDEFTMVGLDGKNHTMSITASGPDLIAGLCEWQKHFNPIGDSDPRHWDVATLITRKDLYKIVDGMRDHGLLGRANIGQICHLENSCNINQDDGLESGLVITHEIGHNLNLLHDPDYGCPNGRNVMSSARASGPASYAWSPCSATHLARFFQTPKSSCLLDVPLTDDPNVDLLPFDVLPGVRYNRLAQCKLNVGRHVNKICGNRKTTSCGQLGCVIGWFCKFISPLEGTWCGKDKWCLGGFCISSIGGIPNPIDGGWGPYTGTFSECSRSCGSGVRWQRRFCKNPTPRFGGKACVGPAALMEVCNTNPCPGLQTADDFRSAECAATNDVAFHGELYNWKAYIDGEVEGNELCSLYCVPPDDAFKTLRGSDLVSAGTQCWLNTEPDELRRTRLCVDGICEEFGCDGVYHSGKMFDVCRKCDGSGRTCTRVSGTRTSVLPRYQQFWTFLRIPAGSVGINITNNNFRYNQFALSIGGEDVFRSVIWNRIAKKRHSRGPNLIQHNWVAYRWESIRVLSGPTSDEIVVDAMQERHPRTHGSKVNPIFTWEWYEPITKPVTYFWDAAPLTTECSVTCGGGNITMMIFCIEEISGEMVNVSRRFCNETTMPNEFPECNTQLCPGLNWVTNEWSECSSDCGPGTRYRTLDCIDVDTQAAAEAGECLAAHGHQPSTSEDCVAPCPTTAPTTAAATTPQTTPVPTTHMTSAVTTHPTTAAAAPQSTPDGATTLSTAAAATSAGATTQLTSMAATPATSRPPSDPEPATQPTTVAATRLTPDAATDSTTTTAAAAGHDATLNGELHETASSSTAHQGVAITTRLSSASGATSGSSEDVATTSPADSEASSGGATASRSAETDPPPLRSIPARARALTPALFVDFLSILVSVAVANFMFDFRE